MPRLLALLCILSVFIPAFIMGDPLRSLFMPLTLAVGFAMISSYLLSSTFVPIMCVCLLKHDGEHGEEEAGPVRPGAQGLSQGSSSWFVGCDWLVVPVYLVRLRAWSSACWGCRSAPSCSRRSTPGEFVLRFRPPPGSNFELTRRDGA